MEKVKITQEQANAIERWPTKEQLITAKAAGLLEHGRDEPIADMSMEELVKALYIGYEVEEEFKKFDWVTFGGKHTGIIIDIDEFDKMYKTDIRNENGVKQMFPFGTDRLRHATPSEIAKEKERRFFNRHDRDVWELRKGDVLIRLGTNHLVTITHVSGLNTFLNGEPQQHSSVKDHYIVACFAEKRLDGDSDE